MTFSSPSSCAASTSASMPPKSSAEVAVAASEPPSPPLPSEPPSSEPPHALRVRPTVTTATAVRKVLRRTCPPEVVPYLPSAPLTPGGRRRDCGGTGPLAGGYGTRMCGERSATAELGLAGAALQEGAHARLLVLGVEQLGEQARLQHQALVERSVEAAVDRPLGSGEGQR